MPKRRYVRPDRYPSKYHIWYQPDTTEDHQVYWPAPRKTRCGKWFKSGTYTTTPPQFKPADWEVCWCCCQGDKLRRDKDA